MSPPRPRLSLSAFRASAGLLLALALGVWAYWLLTDNSPFTFFQQNLLFLGKTTSALLSALLAFLLVFAVWLPPTAFLRQFTTLPPLREAFRPAPGKNWIETIQAERATLRRETLRQLDRPADDPARQAFFRRFGIIAIAVGTVATLITGTLWWFNAGFIWREGIAIALVGLLGGLLTVLTGRPGIFNTPRIESIERAMKVGLWLFIALMCVIACFFLAVVMVDPRGW